VTGKGTPGTHWLALHSLTKSAVCEEVRPNNIIEKYSDAGWLLAGKLFDHEDLVWTRQAIFSYFVLLF
jgi:hypothetical protein